MTRTTAPGPETNAAKPYQATPAERAAARERLERGKQRGAAPRIRIAGDGDSACQIMVEHSSPSLGQALVMRALGTTDADFLEGLLGQLVNVGARGGKPDQSGLNFMIAMVKGIAPRDEAEAMMAAQMAAVHMATMTFARRLAHVENVPQQDSTSNAFNKLARTYAAQMEALKRYRTGGEQKVTVHHVTVNEGGQAIVGSVSAAPGGGGASGKGKATP